MGYLLSDGQGTCTFDPRGTEDCNEFVCNIDCKVEVSSTVDGACSVTCGRGKKSRTQTSVVVTEPQGAGKRCPQKLSKTWDVDCYRSDCPRKL